MRIGDYSEFSTVPSYEFFKDTIGYVVGVEEDLETNALAVFIPKFQIGMVDTLKEGMKDNKLNIKTKLLNVKNKSIFKKNVTETNYTILRALSPGNAGIPKYSYYEKVIVKVFDSDIKTMSFYPYSFDDSGDRLEGDDYKIMVPAKGPKDDESAPNSKENNYYFDMDSRKDRQRITIGTTKANGEKFAYQILLDSKNGTFSVSDGTKRTMIMNSAEDALLFYTEEGSCIEARKDVINLIAKKINIKGSQEVNIETKNYTLKTDNQKETAKKSDLKQDTLTVTSKQGTYKIQTEKHEGMRMNIKEAIGVQMDTVMAAVNGLMAAATVSYGGSPSIDVPISVPPNTSKTANGNQQIEKGKMEVKQGSITVGPGLPLVKYNELAGLLQTLAGMIDMALAAGETRLPPAASAAVSGAKSGLATTMIKGA